MDAPLADPNFEVLRRELREGFGALRQEIATLRTDLERRIDESAAETRRYVDAGDAETRRYIDARIGTSETETRRHFGVFAESMTGKLELVVEGLRGVNERLDRFQGDVAEQFARVDRRFLHLEARLPHRRGR